VTAARWKVALAAIAVVLVVAALAWWVWERGAPDRRKAERLAQLCRWASIDIRRGASGVRSVLLPQEFESDFGLSDYVEFLERQAGAGYLRYGPEALPDGRIRPGRQAVPVAAPDAQYKVELQADKTQSSLEPNFDAARIVITETSSGALIAALGYVAESGGGRFFCPRGFSLDDYARELVPYVLGAQSADRKAAVAKKIRESGAAVRR